MNTSRGLNAVRDQSSDLEPMVYALLKWFGSEARDLPWRRTTDPYAIWISEVMLQQTQIVTVLPYWERWMQRLPDVASLAHATPDNVLKLWEGLGYYRRARHLHAAAQVVVQRFGGTFPIAFDDVLALPGVGRYTAGAICSIAFDQPTPILDGNVTRVIARIFAIAGPVRSSRIQARLWTRARQLVDSADRMRKSGDRACSSLNQALMELGATICRPRPECERCPIADACRARRMGRVDVLPNLGKRPATERRRFVALLALRNGRLAVRRRPAHELNGGLWEFPNLEITGPDAAMDLAKLSRSWFGGEPLSVEPLCRVHHSITRFRIELRAHVVRLSRKLLAHPDPNLRWRTRREIEKLAMPSAHRKIVQALGTSGNPHPCRRRPDA